MADQVETDTSSAAGGTNGHVMLTKEQQAARDRAAFLADGEWDDEGKGAEKPVVEAKPKADDKAKPKPAPVKPADEVDDEGDAAGDDDLEDEIDEVELDDEGDVDEGGDVDEDEDEDEIAAGADGKADPELAKRLARVQKTEKRQRDALARDRQQFEQAQAAFVAEWKPKIAEAEEFAKLKANANPYNAARILLSLGLSEDDLEEAARDVFAHSKKGSADPKNKEAIAKSRRERELGDRLTATEKKLADRDEQDRKRAEELAVADGAKKLLAKTAKAIGDEQPLLKRIKNPERLHAKLAEATIRLQDKLGEMPKAGRVVRYAEKLYRRELEEMGVDVEAIAKAPVKPAAGATGAKKPDKAAAGKPDGANAGDGKTTPIVVQSRRARDPLKADIVRELYELDANAS